MARGVFESWNFAAQRAVMLLGGGFSLYPARKCLDRKTALRMWTENVTWFSNEEGRKGRIQVG